MHAHPPQSPETVLEKIRRWLLEQLATGQQFTVDLQISSDDRRNLRVKMRPPWQH